MKFGRTLGVVLAVFLHIGFLLFGGIIFNSEDAEQAAITDVDLLADDAVNDNKPEDPHEKPPAPPEENTEPVEEAPPDAEEVVRSLEPPSAAASAPALEAASLSAIEAALSGHAGAAGEGGETISFASGGRIGGTAKASALEEKFDSAFSLAEIDQRPRAVMQVAPNYPTELRGKKVEGVVTIIFVVDASGRVVNPKVEKSSNPAFERPALEAVRQWKFEPAVKGGARVGCRMRAPIRFQPN